MAAGVAVWLRARRVGVLACLGYSLFLAANATAVWGGVFPFLPMEIQTPTMTTRFFAAQTSLFVLRFALGAALAYARPETARRFHPVGTALLYVLGWSCLIAISYADGIPSDVAATVSTATAASTAAEVLPMCGGALIGWATASFFLAWQCVFAGQPRAVANMQIIVANIAAPVAYLLLCLIPQAVTALLVALVVMPIFALCIVLVGREIDFDAPMFADVPREHPGVYRLAVKDYWRNALCVGSVAFSCGVIRALAAESPQTAGVINVASMVALFLCASVFLALWRTRPLRLNTSMLFHTLFPLLTTAFVLLPIFGGGYLDVFATCLYAVYGCVVALTMIQCAQASLDRAVNPVFMYGFVAGIMYGLHDLGFLFGAYAQGSTAFGLSSSATAGLTAIYMLGIMFFLAQGGLRAAVSPNHLQAGRVELVPTGARRIRRRTAPRAGEERVLPLGGAPASGATGQVEGAEPCRHEGSAARPVQLAYADKIAKQCSLMRTHFKLTEREAQIIEDMARGYTVAATAEHLGVSENTVRTHSRRVYAKLDIHKKQQLIELVRTFDPGAIHEG